MGVKIKDNNKIPDLMKNLSGMKKRQLEVGVLEDGEQAMIAHVNEYGVDIDVTDEMRGYLSAMGLHLRKDTTVIRIPERSFLRSGWDENEDDISKKIEDLLPEVLDLDIDPETFIDMIGLEVVGRLKDRLIEVSDPPNHPFTEEQKGSSNPLVGREGSLLDSITHRVK
ncbi:hypothetical protein G4V62_13820 [Bacillaceae bacterium SIJ1]|uniref:hypothetical protein n=1 Tax=Litoribacterium kuwaitense TaxID=1398745 RepID=UPI0013EDAF1A|nr:hypothetical protein [Litoribacterium kuwaitense]NGP45972.1 hypothetical protein [Litoribacterium kuwaitense]